MVHELQEGSQGESQHLTVTVKIKNAVKRYLVARKKPVQLSKLDKRKKSPPSPNKTGYSLTAGGAIKYLHL